MDALALPVRQATAEWAEARRSGIGGSDAPVVVGESPYRSPYELWAEKLRLVQPPEENEAMTWGRRLEPVVAAAYTEATGRRLRRVRRLLRSRERPWQLASLDRAVVGEQRLVEIKTTRSPAGMARKQSQGMSSPRSSITSR
jgi:putative phage-type endonuclease